VWQRVKQSVLSICGGTGASISGTGDTVLDQELLKRMRSQDKAAMALLLVLYAGSLYFSAQLSYRQANNDSPVTYYADPRIDTAVLEDDDDAETFLATFNSPPKEIYLHVTGLVHVPEGDVNNGAVGTRDFADIEWQDEPHRIEFSFALDLGPWLIRDESQEDFSASADIPREPGCVGVPEEDMSALSSFLASNTNDLACIDLHKQVEWPEWEELAANIKWKIRQTGFPGYISVWHTGDEVLTIHKNRPWANFMHSRTTKILCVLSVFGWMFYQPYMWLRHLSVPVRCKYLVDSPIDRFWPLISNKIDARGFHGSRDERSEGAAETWENFGY